MHQLVSLDMSASSRWTTINKCMTPTICDSDYIPRLYIKLLAFNAQ